MVSIIALAALGGLTAAAATAVTTGDASAALNAIHAVPHGLQVALAHVPSWTNAHRVLTEHLSAYAQNSGTGAAGTATLEAVRKGLGLGLRR